MILENEAGLLKDQTHFANFVSQQSSGDGLFLDATDLLRQAVDLLRLEENAAAIKLLKSACEIDSANAQMHAFLGAALAEELQIDEAQSELELALKLDNQNAFIHLKAGELMLLLGRTPEALQYLERAYKLPAPSPQTRLYIVNLLRQTRQNSKKIVPRENKLLGVGVFKSAKAFFSRARDKKVLGIQPVVLPEQNRGEL